MKRICISAITSKGPTPTSTPPVGPKLSAHDFALRVPGGHRSACRPRSQRVQLVGRPDDSGSPSVNAGLGHVFSAQPCIPRRWPVGSQRAVKHMSSTQAPVPADNFIRPTRQKLSAFRVRPADRSRLNNRVSIRQHRDHPHGDALAGSVGLLNIDRRRWLDRVLVPPLCWLVALLHRLHGPETMPGDVQRILIIVLSEMGALVLTRPMFDRLRENHPSATFYVLCSEQNRAALDLLDEVPR